MKRMTEREKKKKKDRKKRETPSKKEGWLRQYVVQ